MAKEYQGVLQGQEGKYTLTQIDAWCILHPWRVNMTRHRCCRHCCCTPDDDGPGFDWAEVGRKRKEDYAKRIAKAVEVLAKDPVDHVQFGLFPEGGAYVPCTLVLESRSTIELMIPKGIEYDVSRTQINYVEDTDGVFYLWFDDDQFRCYVDAVNIDLRSTGGKIPYLGGSK
jgi:hypothetical protein